MTKKMILLSTTALILTHSIGLSPAFADDGEADDIQYTLTIENQTGENIHSLKIATGAEGDAAPDKEGWTKFEDLLAEDNILEDEESVDLNYTSEDDWILNAEEADILGETEDDDLVFEDLDISADNDHDHITLHADGTATIEAVETNDKEE